MRLLLLRHAKADSNQPGKPDFERRLNERGNRAAPAIGRHLQSHGLVPKQILCSSARRTRETLAHILPLLATNPAVSFSDTIYDADADQLLKIIQQHGGRDSPMLIVGHNPTIQDLALDLAGSGAVRLIDQIRKKYPTAALAVLDAVIDNWADLAGGSAKLVTFVCPRELE